MMNGYILGIDAGSVSLSAVLIDSDGRIIKRFSRAHEGNIKEALSCLEDELDLNLITSVALTGRQGVRIRHSLYVDSRMACIRSVEQRYPEARSILLVGGEQFSLIRFNREGDYDSVRTNTSCAAGTGSFLDQQAGRLNLSDSSELSRVALDNRDEPPLVATRCAVFAKTDLIHAQQEGYSLSAISDGLCRGLAKNLVDTLFRDNDTEGPVLFTGGVSANQAVGSHIKNMLNLPMITDALGQYQGAIGAALCLLDESAGLVPEKPASLYLSEEKDRSEFYPPLTLQLSEYPDFKSYRTWEQAVIGRKGQPFVEVDLYRALPESLETYLGIDIGSTSTKAVLCDPRGTVYGGFYTRTSGRPLEAVQALFEAVTLAAESENCRLLIRGSGTTGSGRKFIGNLISADIVLDEISAHARAAVELDPEVDTILEIGGQDAKFTTLKNGRVTLSVMNNVCAAGTGSFLEEQASRLGLSVRDYASMTDGQRAPLVSDRCTVFMERDINHLLSEGCSVSEVLTAALHSVRENYLRKVAVTSAVGKKVFFQGATAKNRSLVAAFEQKLNLPILVSPYCHLTGALGAALTLMDDSVSSDAFCGLDLYKQTIPVRQEVCTLCGNHCKLTVADLEERSVAFGFLCGRDYETENYVNTNKSGWDLLKERNRAETSLQKDYSGRNKELQESRESNPVIGIPDALHLVEDRAYWEIFFSQLGLKTVNSRGLKDGISRGKPLMGSEFCAPVTSLFGHTAKLLEEGVDYIFLPHYMERKTGKDGESRKFCYFTQFATALVSQGVSEDRLITPLAATRYSLFLIKGELYKALSSIPGIKISFLQISSALDKAEEFRLRQNDSLRELFRNNCSTDPSSPDVVLLGRPYSVLPEGMNKGIPGIFGTLGIRAFYQDMLDLENGDYSRIEGLLKEINWSFAEKILQAAEIIVQTEGLYPVLLSSFKCGPDSFLTEYFRKILDAHDKPYLILELDEHDSSVGYETRIEAAVRSFRNHREEELGEAGSRAGRGREYEGLNPRYSRKFDRRKTLVLPNWDEYAIPLLADIFNAQGYKALVMEESDQSIRKSLKWNSGMCIPMNALVEGFVDTVKNHGLNPGECSLWIPYANLSCNIRMFPHHIQEIFKVYGEGMEKAEVFQGIIAFSDISPLLSISAYQAYMFSGLIRRISCRIRPYEKVKGQTDSAVEKALSLLSDLFLGRRKNTGQTVQEIISLFEWISYDREARKPKVAIFGDIYVRENPVMNQNIISYIEENGGEVVTIPYHEFTRMTAEMYFKRWGRELRLKKLLSLKPMLAAMEQMEKWYYRYFEKVLEQPIPLYKENPKEILEPYHVLLDHEGESQDNLLKTWYISRQYPDLSLFLQLNPGFCCAGNVTEAMSSKIHEVTGVPILSITYDGTGGFKNDAVLPYLKYSSGWNAPGDSAEIAQAD
ncbi:CoA activase [Oceanispirochaeta sp. M2]|nr:CoA activase [Oceanispirochaeta sp. M2]NPD71969.1 CoA activase [Oceanispirochaeta sp. M1]RDG32775.1 CoA activase [Oceanispirochaeta sp. M1]